MTPRKPRRNRRLDSQIASFLILLLVLGPMPSYAFHFPWDQGHDIFNPVPPEDPDPGDDDCKASGSPFEVASGNFVLESQDINLPTLGLNAAGSLEIRRSYNSRDMRTGPLGYGWTFTYDQRLVETTDGVTHYAVCHQGSGKREVFVRQADGSYTAPADLYSTLVKNADGTFLLTERDGTRRSFDADGRLAAIRDRYGNGISFSYDDTGFPTEISDGRGRSIRLTKGPNGLLASATDSASRTFLYDYDAAGNLVAFTDALGNATRYQYDASHNLTKIVEPPGRIVQDITYDSSGRITSYLEKGARWTVSYFPAERRVVKRDALNNSWTLFYNENGNVTRIVDPLGGAESYSYDANFNVASVTNKNGSTATLAHDEKGNLLSIRDPQGNVVSADYEPNFNRISRLRDARGNVTVLEYNEDGDLVSITDALGNTAANTYDGNGLLTRRTDAGGNSGQYFYDNAGNLVGETDPAGNQKSFAYDALGNVVSSMDAEGRTTSYTYDAAGRVLTATDEGGGVTRYEYDEVGNMIRVTDPRGSSNTFEYDAFRRMVKSTNPLGQVQEITYDVRGNLSQVRDGNGQVTQYFYDQAGRLIRRQAPDNDTQFTYDRAGNMLTATDGDTALQYTYDSMNRIIEAKTLARPNQPATTITYSYDANGNRTSMVSGGVTTTYGYDALNRPVRIANSLGSETRYEYDATSRRTRMVLPDGSEQTHAYNPLGHLTQLAARLGTETITDYRFSYDREGNRVRIEEPDGPRDYTYDDLDQLLGGTVPSGSDESYTYDAAGNRLSSHLSAMYRYDAANRLLEDSLFLYGYDGNGSRTTRTEKATGSVTRYTYDSQNQLARIDFPAGGFATYRYDGLNRRIEKNVNGVVTRFVYDGEDLAFEYDGANTLVARYMHGPGIDEPLAVERGGTTYVFHRDGTGSVTALTHGGSVERREYDSFGLLLEGNAGTTAYAYTARELDAESGLYYYRHRYYDPAVGRFLQEDPLGFTGGSNLYAYVGNNPLNYIDPYGLQVVEGALTAAGGAVVADGPLPVGDVIAVGILIGLGIYLLLNPPKPIPIDIPIPRDPPQQRRGKWTCEAQCNVQAIGKTCCPDRTFGSGSGPDQTIACQNAKRAATQSTPRGCYPRHCYCPRCWKN